ncbi:MAG: proton-conducting membrane transporter [Haloarculaceae archaeon]
MAGPSLTDEADWTAGVAAVALFVVFWVVFAGAQFPAPTGFPGEGSITAALGFAMLDLGDLASYASDSFLAAFEIIDLVLVAALVGAVTLARRDSEDVRPLADGGRERGGDD